MMKMRTNILRILPIALFCSVLSSCIFWSSDINYREDFIKKSQIPLFRENMCTYIDTLINTDGYYAFAPDDSTYRQRHTLTPFTFGNDGSYQQVTIKDEYLYLKKKNIDISNKADRSVDGSYTINGDTIYATYFWNAGVNIGGGVVSLKFKILDRNTLMLCESDSYEDDYYAQKGSDVARNINKIYKFVPVSRLPEVVNYIKSKKWMWKDKSEWKRYMNENKK